jgi:hypothetical protein
MILCVLVAAMLSVAMVGVETCLFKSDEVSGLNRLCRYTCPSGDYSKTIKAVEICPLSIKR